MSSSSEGQIAEGVITGDLQVSVEEPVRRWRLSSEQINMNPGWRERVPNTGDKCGSTSFYLLQPVQAMEHLTSPLYRNRLDLRSCPRGASERMLRDDTKR